MNKIRLLLTVVSLVVAVFLGSCSKEASEQVSNDEYYVHYTCSSPSTVSYKNEKNEMVGNLSGTGLDVAIGPVKKGFEAIVTGHCALNSYYHPSARIQISKNGSPWIDKGIQNIGDGGNISLHYTIDF